VKEQGRQRGAGMGGGGRQLERSTKVPDSALSEFTLLLSANLTANSYWIFAKYYVKHSGDSILFHLHYSHFTDKEIGA
jgi:hypothetical protein